MPVPKRTKSLLPLLLVASAACTTLPAPKQHWYEFPKDAYLDEGLRPHSLVGTVRARTEFPSLDPEYDFEKLCRNYYDKSVTDLVKMAKAKGADAVIEVRSVVFLETGRKETYKTAECADDGEEGQSLAEGVAVKWSADAPAAAETEPAIEEAKAAAATPASQAASQPITTPSPVRPVRPTPANASVKAPTPAAKAAIILRTEEETYRETTDESRHFALLDGMARDAFESGQPAKAHDYAERLLAAAPAHKGQWSYGNAIHRGNVILGRLALQQGDVVKAKTYLLLAGKTPGSPQLDSFGPNMALAKDLLERGERQAVLDYLDLCAKFWHDDFARRQLADWKGEIQSGKTPDFWAHLRD